MALRYEWRSRAEGDEAILAVEEGSYAVVKVWVADTDRLADLLNDMKEFDPTSGNGVGDSQRSPEEWGRLVMARSEDGDILNIDPELYWGGIGYWFRSRGRDPHPFGARH